MTWSLLNIYGKIVKLKKKKKKEEERKKELELKDWKCFQPIHTAKNKVFLEEDTNGVAK